MHSYEWISVVIFGSLPKSNFLRAFGVCLDLVKLFLVDAISIDFYAVFNLHWFSAISMFQVEEWLYKRFECFKNSNNYFIYLFMCRKGGCTDAYVCMVTDSQPLLENNLMNVYKLGMDEVVMAPLMYI